MTSYKSKAIIAGAISITLIGIITIIVLWPTNFNKAQSDDELTASDVMIDESKLNLVNLHMSVTNHTIITTSTMIVIGIIILINISVKGYTSSKRRKKQKRTRDWRDFTMSSYPSTSTWENPRPFPMEQQHNWQARQYFNDQQGWSSAQGEHPSTQPQPQPQPHQAPRQDQTPGGQ